MGQNKRESNIQVGIWSGSEETNSLSNSKRIGALVYKVLWSWRQALYLINLWNYLVCFIGIAKKANPILLKQSYSTERKKTRTLKEND